MSITIELTEIEQRVLRHGINEWFGPASLSDELAVAMGFNDRDDLFEDGVRLRKALANAQPLSSWDWARILVMTEFVFSSNVFGAGLDWSIVTGIQDDETIQVLRGLQHKLGKAGIGRREFGPQNEYLYQRSAATSIRLFRGGNTSFDKLMSSLDSTIDAFSTDLDNLIALRSQLQSIDNESEHGRTAETSKDDEAKQAINQFVDALREDPSFRTRGFWF